MGRLASACSSLPMTGCTPCPVLGCPGASIAFCPREPFADELYGIRHAPVPLFLFPWARQDLPGPHPTPKWSWGYTKDSLPACPPPTCSHNSPLPTVSTEPISEETVRSDLLIPAARPVDAGNYTCTAANFLGNTSVAITLWVGAPWASTPDPGWAPIGPAEPGAHVEVRIAKQTVYGITLEWFAAAAAEPGEIWYTLLVGRYDAAQKDAIYIGPGVNTYSVTDLLPATKYEVCVAVRNQAPRKGQCVVFVTGSDVSQLEQREKLIHIIVIVCAMVLAVPAGMYACTAEARPGCLARCPGACPRRRRGGQAQAAGSKESTLDSLPAGSEDGLCRPEGGRGGRRPPAREDPGKTRPPHRNSADLY